MRDLFSTIPTTFFQPLAAPGAPLYVEVLFSLLAEAQRQPEPLSRDLAINLIYTLLADPARLEMITDAVADDLAAEAADSTDQTQLRATTILRYLEQCGWLRSETQLDFT